STLFFLITRRPPTPPLFPTRRSSDLDQSFWGDYDMLSTGLVPEPTLDTVTFRNGPLLAARRTINDPVRGPVTTSDILFNPSTVLDRKSTRLNSSHVKISYAVFCLKKK